MASEKEIKKALDSAFDVCFETSCFLGNIIAGCGKTDPPEKSDIEIKKKADAYIKWYKKHSRFNPY